ADEPEDATSSAETLSAEGRPLGTPAYMSPEQARGERDAIGPASDVFALGVVLWETIAARPLRTGSPPEVVDRARTEPVPPLPASVPSPIRRVVEAATELDPAARPADGAALAERLAAAIRELEPEPAPSPAARVSRRHVLLAGGLAVASGGAWAGYRAWATWNHKRVLVQTSLPGADAWLVPLNGYGEPDSAAEVYDVEGPTPGWARCPPGDYLVVASKTKDGPDGEEEFWNEVVRHVAEDGQPSGGFRHRSFAQTDDGLVLPEIELFSDRQISRLLEPTGTRLREAPGDTISLRRSDRPREGSAASTAPDAVAGAAPEYFSVPRFLATPQPLRDLAAWRAVGRRLDESADPLSLASERAEDGRIVNVSHAVAVDVLESAGLRLPTEVECEQLRQRRMTVGTGAEWTATAAEFDPDPRFEEFLRSAWHLGRAYVARMLSPEPDVVGPATARTLISGMKTPWLGFRGVRSAGPRRKPTDFVRPAAAPTRSEASADALGRLEAQGYVTRPERSASSPAETAGEPTGGR
ncbi:protein kinase, partial [Alienimonas sp. DA493]|uniref:protein kinase n=1 Tax=Alienimonas sp. DA493 TaxID=3373605 RepID=UPI003754699B